MFQEQSVDAKSPPTDYPKLRNNLFGLITGYWNTQAIYAVAKLSIPDHLIKGSLSALELAERVGCNADMLDRFLRTLTSIGLFRRDEHSRYYLTPLSQLLCASSPVTMRPQALMHAEEQYSAWGEALTNVMGRGVAFEKRFGQSYFDYLDENRESYSTFSQAQAGYSAYVAMSVVDAYDFSPYSSVVDVGGGYGVLLSNILGRFSDVEGILFDRPAVVEAFQASETYRRLAGRLSTTGGDFFVDIPSGGDVYILSLLIHDWDDDRARVILENCRRAMPRDGKLLIVELVLPENDEPFFGKWLDLHMAILLGARERSVAQFRSLLEDAGFSLDRTIETRSGMKIVEATPKR